MEWDRIWGGGLERTGLGLYLEFGGEFLGIDFVGEVGVGRRGVAVSLEFGAELPGIQFEVQFWIGTRWVYPWNLGQNFQG